MEAAGSAGIKWRTLALEARSGEASLRANDDVVVEGERIYLNRSPGMDCINDSQLVAKVYRVALHCRDLIMATAVVKASSEVAKDGSVGLVYDEPLPSSGS